MDFNFHRKRSRKVPGLNTTSTADISFILLVFFLMVTSMDPDKGLPRQLPKLDEEKVEKITEVDRANVLTISLEADGGILLDDKPTKLKDIRKEVADFVFTCPQPKKHILSVNVSPEADYDQYFQLQNEMILAYRDIRNACAQQKYKTGYLNLTKEQQARIKQQFPQRIAENYEKPESKTDNR